MKNVGISTVASFIQHCSKLESLGVWWSLGSSYRWLFENKHVFATLYWYHAAPFCFVLFACVWSGVGVSSCCSISQWDVRNEIIEAAGGHDTWQISGKTCPRAGVHQRQGCFLSLHEALADRCPEGSPADVGAGTGHTSASPTWNFSRTSDLIFLQEQIKAMWQLLPLLCGWIWQWTLAFLIPAF